MPNNNESEQIYHQHPKEESALIRFARPIWLRLKETKLFLSFRHSRLNPFHTHLQNIKSATLEEAKERAIQQNLRYFEYNGIRVSTDEPYSLVTEAGKRKRIFRNGRNALDVLPRNAKGIPDLTAEEPIVIAILPIEGPSLVGHAALQYKNYVVNRMRYKMDTKPLLPRYGTIPDYYLIYPSQVGMKPKDIIRAIQKTNIARSGEYNLTFNNCAGSVDYALRMAGAKNLDQYGPDSTRIFFPAPGNNPFHKGLQEWCRTYGIHVYASELEQVYKYNYIANHQEMADEYKSVRQRVLQKKAYKNSLKCISNKVKTNLKSLLGIPKKGRNGY